MNTLLHDRFETTDGSRADATAFVDDGARSIPLAAFAVLAGGGDAFVGSGLIADPLHAAHAAQSAFEVHSNGAGTNVVEQVRKDIVRMLTHNPRLSDRVLRMKRVCVDVIPRGKAMSQWGFPAQMNDMCAGLFWDHPCWPVARIALRFEHLSQDKALVVHEVAHALHRLAFSKGEQELIDRTVGPVVGAGAAVDEMFAIYSEAEFLAAFDDSDKRAPGIYGWARKMWSDDHVFTRFVRKLYFPHKPLAGDKVQKGERWKNYLGGSRR